MNTTWEQDQQDLLVLIAQLEAARVQRCLLGAIRYANTPAQCVELLWFSLKNATDSVPPPERPERP